MGVVTGLGVSERRVPGKQTCVSCGLARDGDEDKTMSAQVNGPRYGGGF